MKRTAAVYVVAAKRTPFGSFLGKLNQFKATQLAAIAVRGAMNSRGIQPELIDEVILGNALSAGLGMNPAKQVVFEAGIENIARTGNVNKGCGSGMKAFTLACESILSGNSHCVITGGFESMSNVPHYLNYHRRGTQLGNQAIQDGCLIDGQTDIYNKCALGVCAEKTAQDFQLTRQAQDEYAIKSYQRAITAAKAGKFKDEISPVDVTEREKMSHDEEPMRFKRESFPLSNPTFTQDGTITSANSANLSDGAVALVLMSEEALKRSGLSPIARVVSFGEFEVDPMDFCLAGTKSIERALSVAAIQQSKIDYFEIHENFAVTAITNAKLMDIDITKLNINGGGIALGHPLGASGARVIQSLMTVLKQQKGKLGVATISNGGGGGTSVILENLC